MARKLATRQTAAPPRGSFWDSADFGQLELENGEDLADRPARKLAAPSASPHHRDL